VKRDKVTCPLGDQTGEAPFQYMGPSSVGVVVGCTRRLDADGHRIHDGDNDYPYCRLIKVLWTCFYAPPIETPPPLPWTTMHAGCLARGPKVGQHISWNLRPAPW
jgi:hypothetical protein